MVGLDVGDKPPLKTFVPLDGDNGLFAIRYSPLQSSGSEVTFVKTVSGVQLLRLYTAYKVVSVEGLKSAPAGYSGMGVMSVESTIGAIVHPTNSKSKLQGVGLGSVIPKVQSSSVSGMSVGVTVPCPGIKWTVAGDSMVRCSVTTLSQPLPCGKGIVSL